MRPQSYGDFAGVISMAQAMLKANSHIVHSATWQGTDIANRPEMATHELAHCSFRVSMVPASTRESLPLLQKNIKPNLPWADRHFEERVCGFPINPGKEWENWPYNKSAAKFLDERGMFNHNYMERYWPKHAGHLVVPTLHADDWLDPLITGTDIPTHRGIMYEYGDLNDVVQLLASDPYTRQAYLPIWFPEDTGGGSKRAPCTIGYHFLMREGLLDINYHIRSCDFVRHFRDDLYLTARLLLWVIDRCAEIDPRWRDVRPGQFVMQIGSLHIFRNDYIMLFGGNK